MVSQMDVIYLIFLLVTHSFEWPSGCKQISNFYCILHLKMVEYFVSTTNVSRMVCKSCLNSQCCSIYIYSNIPIKMLEYMHGFKRMLYSKIFVIRTHIRIRQVVI